MRVEKNLKSIVSKYLYNVITSNNCVEMNSNIHFARFQSVPKSLLKIGFIVQSIGGSLTPSFFYSSKSIGGLK